MTLAVAIADDETGRVAIWKLSRDGNAISMKRQGTLAQGTSKHQHPVSSVAISDDGRWVASGDMAGNVLLWNPDAVPAIDNGISIVNDIAILGESKSGLRVMTASSDDSAKVWDPRLDADHKKGREIISLRRHNGDVTSVDITDNGNLLMTAGRDGAVILWPAEPPPPNLFDELQEEPEPN